MAITSRDELRARAEAALSSGEQFSATMVVELLNALDTAERRYRALRDTVFSVRVIEGTTEWEANGNLRPPTAPERPTSEIQGKLLDDLADRIAPPA